MSAMPTATTQDHTRPSGSGFVPPPVTKIEDTGLPLLMLQDLALKILYFRGYLNGFQLAEAMALPFAGLVEHIADNLKKEKYVEVKSSQMGIGEGAYLYAISDAGIARAREALERSQYAGPAPVPIETFNQAIIRQARGRTTVTSRSMRQALSDLLLEEKTFHKIGPAVNSGASIFLYGPPGNGKTTIASAIGKMTAS
ncbi:MAG: ATP-binding protein, partial [Chloroflexota bacterium]